MKKSQLSLLRKLATSCGLLMLLQSAQAQFSFPVYEAFGYANNETLGTTGSSGTNWQSGNTPASFTDTSATNYPQRFYIITP